MTDAAWKGRLGHQRKRLAVEWTSCSRPFPRKRIWLASVRHIFGGGRGVAVAPLVHIGFGWGGGARIGAVLERETKPPLPRCLNVWDTLRTHHF